ncbi:class I SAM-dependent methyltransferase [Streptomyces kanamyceticus]|uniref:Class I SAM-dependent methyltransferase n=1 Tax=Streptomyces kanamyceticus TaxID=1967 RepID=A0A5J6GHA5_STRKN|nr:class I SAM-dependent methyltransferase [Streptomyces kanamyceticus]QEU94859.1 class I SAM-dependent methyltransferase [Streptomyces kanamyceticus]
MTTDAAQRVAERRPAYLAELARGTERFHEPRRTECPWCGSSRLRVRLRTTDLIQHKPGTFTLDQCEACAHSFQNPRLTPEGLDFYRKDFYDGLGGKAAEQLLGAASGDRRQLSRARALRAFDEPECWLDVGTGRARFPALAKQLLPYTSFDGLDPGDGVEEGVRRGRIEEGHRGTLTELAADLAGRYDAMSMFHYLEHRPDPREELRAARTVLRPGGHLMIEAPDPECRYTRLLGKWWVSYLQPQHLHFVPLENLEKELTELGFTVVGVERRAPHVPFDLATAVALLLDSRFPRADVPWRARPATPLQLKLRQAARWTSAPLVAAARGLDRALPPLLTRTGFSNAYRVIARRGDDT